MQAGNRRRGSGRVTPSKLRRSAVIAVDGALALGAGALGGLFATGGASAAAPTPGWTGTQTPAPAASDAPASPDPGVNFAADSCVSAAFCAAGGSYVDSSGDAQALLGVKAGGTWTPVGAPLPSNADRSNNSDIQAVSCPSVGLCVATGSYKDSTNKFHSL